MRCDPTKKLEQKGCFVLHRTRHLFVHQETAVIKSIRAHLAECGIVTPLYVMVWKNSSMWSLTPGLERPSVTRECLALLDKQLRLLKA
jgi:transposase